MSKDAWLDWYRDKRVEECVVDFGRMFKEAAATRILDFGCGTGRNTVYLVRVGFEVYGFDWSEAAVAATKQELSCHWKEMKQESHIIISGRTNWYRYSQALLLKRWTKNRSITV